MTALPDLPLPPELAVDDEPLTDDPVAHRFWPKVNRSGPVPEFAPALGPCWLWTATTDGRGYGAFWDGTKLPSGNKRVVKAYRWAWAWANGPVPAGLELDHLCRVTLCVRPAHLEAVTHQENMNRGMTPSAIVHRTGLCIQDHALRGDNVYVNPHGRGVECRTCRNARSAAWHAAHREATA